MTCEEFDSSVAEVARGAAAAPRRDAAIRHAAGCQACEDRLAQERQLSDALRSLAIETRNQEASFRVEAQLLQAFRAQQLQNTLRQSAIAPVPERRWRGLAAAAAVTLVAGGAAVWMQTGRSAPGGEGSPALPIAVTRQAETPVVAPETEAPSNPRAVVSRRAHSAPIVSQPIRQVVQAPAGAPAESARTARPTAGVVEVQELQPQEIVTDFLPVQNGNEPVDGGHLIRVELPRSALQTFGITQVEEPSAGTVQADVLFGADGVAHQIRFVSRNRGREAAQTPPTPSPLKPAGSPLKSEGGRR